MDKLITNAHIQINVERNLYHHTNKQTPNTAHKNAYSIHYINIYISAWIC